MKRINNAARTLLSVFSACYKFIRASYGHSDPLWPSVRAELKAAYALLPMVFSDLSAHMCSIVYAYDACPSGV